MLRKLARKTSVLSAILYISMSWADVFQVDSF